MATKNNLLPACLVNRIATYGTAQQAANLSIAVNTPVLQKIREEVLLQDAGVTLQNTLNAQIPKDTSGTGLRQALSEAAVARVLFMAAGGQLEKWSTEKHSQQFQSQLTKQNGTPDFIYRGRPADAISVSYESRLDVGQDQAKRAKLWPSLLSAIRGKWNLYGPQCIAAVDISTFPDEITTDQVVKFLLEQNWGDRQERSIFLIRGSTLTRLFDS
jgi:hypothetical protein